MVKSISVLFLINLLKAYSFIPFTSSKRNIITANPGLVNQKEKTILKNSVYSDKDNHISFGDFDSGQYCKFRNIYHFPDNKNILPITKDNVIRLFYGWRNTLLNENLIYDDDFKKFRYNFNDENIVYFSWVPYNNKNYVRGLIAAKINTEIEVIKIKSILLAPPREEKIIHQADNFDLLICDLEHLKFIYDGMVNLKIDLYSI